MGARCVCAALAHAKLLISVEACLKCVRRRGKSCAAGTDKVLQDTHIHILKHTHECVAANENFCGYHGAKCLRRNVAAFPAAR